MFTFYILDHWSLLTFVVFIYFLTNYYFYLQFIYPKLEFKIVQIAKIFVVFLGKNKKLLEYLALIRNDTICKPNNSSL